MRAPLNLAATAAALEAFDAAGQRMDDARTVGESIAALAAYEAAREAVGLAFADATADRNDRKDVIEFTRCGAGLAFVRRTVADAKQIDIAKCETY